MRVFLLAAGLGTRLRPLTYAKPKALMPVANRPSIVRLLDLLKPYAIKETFINLHAFPEEIKDEIGGGSWWNMKVHYSYEPELMGTAGAIKKIGMFLADDRFILVNADIVTDFDIRNAIDFHDKSGAQATLIMTEPRSEYSDQLISVGEDGRVLIEKSRMDRVKSGIYTGIGIFEPSVIRMIPHGYSSLIDSILIPLAKEGSLFAYFQDGYWIDIGELDRYIQANKDLISGKTCLPIDGRLVGDNIWIDESAQIDLTVEIEEPALIGKGACIERGVKIGPYAVIGKGCFIDKNARIANSIIWDKCEIARSVTIDGSIVTGSEGITPGKRIIKSILNDGITEPLFGI